MKYIFLMSIIIFQVSCSKGGDSSTNTPTPTPTTPTEFPIAFAVNVDPGLGNILAVVGTSQVINVKLSSNLPSAGVLINVTVTKDLDNSTVYTTSNSSLISDNNITITGLLPGVLSTATVIVASKSNQTNSKTISFKVAAK